MRGSRDFEEEFGCDTSEHSPSSKRNSERTDRRFDENDDEESRTRAPTEAFSQVSRQAPEAFGGWKLKDLQRVRDCFAEVSMQVYAQQGEGIAIGNYELAEVMRRAFRHSLNTDAATRLSSRILRVMDTEKTNSITWNRLFCFMTGLDVEVEEDLDEGIDLMEKALSGELERLLLVPSVKQFGQPESWREMLWAVVEQSASEFYRSPPDGVGPPWLSKAAWSVAVGTQMTVVVSALVMLVESLEKYQNKSGRSGTSTTFAIEIMCICVFTVELFLRAISCPLRPSKIRGPMKTQAEFWMMHWTWVDFLAIMPFYLESTRAIPEDSGASSLTVLRVLRLLKISKAVRVLKLGRHSKGIQMMGIALWRARAALVWMTLMHLMAIILFGALMYHGEKDQVHFNESLKKFVRNNDSEWPDRGEEIFFQSIPDAMWWALVTLTTVGYGEVYPITGLGKTVASMTMLTGIVLLAYPTTILTNVFAGVHNDFKRRLVRREERERLLRDVAAPVSPRRRSLRGGMQSKRLRASSTLVSPPRMMGKKLSLQDIGDIDRSATGLRSRKLQHRGSTASLSSAGGGEFSDLVSSLSGFAASLSQLRREVQSLTSQQSVLEKKLDESLDNLNQRSTEQKDDLLARFVAQRDEMLETYRECHEPADVREDRERRRLQDRVRDLVSLVEPAKVDDLERRFAQMVGRPDELRLLRDSVQQLQKRLAAQTRRKGSGGGVRQ